MAMMAFQPGSTVEYWSASLNQWILARVLGIGQLAGTLDLDCKAGVDVDRVRVVGGPPATDVGVSPRSAAGGPLGLRVGETCFYRSTTHGWIAARVQRFRAEDQTYDLDAKHGVTPSKIFCLRPTVEVEYLSTTTDDWIPASVLRPGQGAETYDLDVKADVHVSRIRPPQGLRCQGALAVTFEPMQPKLEKLREALEAKDAVELRKRMESESALDLVGEELDRANHALWMLEAQPEAIRELRRSSAGTNITALQLALDAAAAAGVADAELEAASQRLRDLKSRTWRYVPKDRHMDLRQEPKVDGKRVRERLNPGDTFLVTEEKRTADGVTYLRLADGRGWAFDHKPNAGRMCERAYPSEDASSAAPWQQRRLGKTVAELRGLQRGCLKASRLEGVTEGGEDDAGIYVILEDVAVTPGMDLCSEREIVATLPAGASARVLEVAWRPACQRMRGRISSPPGWISLLDTQSGKLWAARQ